MFTRKSTIALLATTVFTSIGFAAPAAQPETPGSEKPKMVAEAIHNARVHGLASSQQPIAQAAGSEQAQTVSESIHLKLQHGNVNDSADRRMLEDASRL
ncbi:hypothetical protein [Ramlibacter sp.]|uniref:hypothetical protein n=1 Tax=Ramlibacter sp. TaxID=1917967 RepID=UPI002B732225|nr:hypothetical protein [Ramlibacter sp.]HWI84069.1 hypothetical protein [Ramlibacter sp.]